jgi:hypothetical protein
LKIKVFISLFVLIFTASAFAATVQLQQGGLTFPASVPGVALSSYTSLANAVSTIGATTTDLYCDVATTVITDLTIPANIRLIITTSGVISYSTHTLTLNGLIQAGSYQIFSGTGQVIFNAPPDRIYSQWWGE